MSLRDIHKRTVKRVVMNTNNFAESHQVNGVEIVCQFDVQQEHPLAGALGGYARELATLLIDVDDWPGYPPTVNSEVEVDGRRWLIKSALNDMSAQWVISLQSGVA